MKVKKQRILEVIGKAQWKMEAIMKILPEGDPRRRIVWDRWSLSTGRLWCWLDWLERKRLCE